jgi:BirA family biotin operon repressor/biotin-[acetyl-CoA-carboxylase] ligase
MSRASTPHSFRLPAHLSVESSALSVDRSPVPTTEVAILRQFLAAGPDTVSGARLAKLLGLSRVAVWLQLQKLIRQGFTFEARRSRGYRMVKTPDTLHPALVRAYLNGRLRPSHLVCLDTVDSTNRRGRTPARQRRRPVPLVILASAQTQGRGRLGRVWHSERPATFTHLRLPPPARADPPA